jgi:flagellar motility protein MotE (MotC chaperone)
MLLGVAILLAVGLLLVAAVVVIETRWIARERGYLADQQQTARDERERERERIAQEARALRDRVADRERELDLLRQSLEESYRAKEREWAEERKALLDRIQAPHIAIAKAMPEFASGQGPSDDDIDREWMKRPESRVEWDPDLDPELHGETTGSGQAA